MSRLFTSFLILLIVAKAQPPAPAAQEPEGIPTFRTSTNLVLLHLSVKDSSGKPVETLTKDDFTVLEDGHPQSVSVLEFQRLSRQVLPDVNPTRPAGTSTEPPARRPQADRFRDRRLLVLL